MGDSDAAAVQTEEMTTAQMSDAAMPAEAESAKTLYMFSDMEGCQVLDRNGTPISNSIAMCDPKFYSKLDEMMNNKNMHVAFLGDYFDQGLKVIPSLKGMSDLYDKYGPDRVFIILGNRDINKLRFMYELTHEIKAPTQGGWSAWTNFYNGLAGKTGVDLVHHMLPTSMGAPNRLPNDASKFVGLHSFIPPDYQKDKSDEDALAYLKASFGMGLPQSGGEGDSRSISIAYDKQRKEKEKQKLEAEKQRLEARKNLEEQQRLEARKKLEEQQRLEAQQKLSDEIQEFKFDILAFYKKCKIAHVFDLGNNEKVLLAHGGGFNKGCFFNKAYVESFGQGNGNVTPVNYLQMMENFRIKLSQPPSVPVQKGGELELTPQEKRDRMIKYDDERRANLAAEAAAKKAAAEAKAAAATSVEESVAEYNQLLLDVLNELTTKTNDNEKYTWKFVLLQALGLKPNVEQTNGNQDKIYNSLVQSCSQNGCTGQSSYVKPDIPESPDKERELYEYLKSSGITHVSYGHKPVCFPIPLMYSRANMPGIMFISNDTSNGNRRTEDLGSTIVVGTKIDFSSTPSVASICYISIPGDSSKTDETDFNNKFKSFLDLKLTKENAPQYKPNGDIFQLAYDNGPTVSMNMNLPPPKGFTKLVFTPPPQPAAAVGGRRSRRRRYTKKIKQRSKRRVQKKRAATRSKRERKTRK